MQTAFNHLVRQQLILKAMGYYQGPIDGQWGPMSIEAKKRFESEMEFLPGLPNSGMPFAGHKPWPSGITLDTRSGLLYHPSIEDILAQEKEALAKGPVTRNAVRVHAVPKTVPTEPSTD